MGFMDLFKKPGVTPVQTRNGLKYTFSKAGGIVGGVYQGEKKSALTVIISSDTISMKGYLPSGVSINEKFEIIGPAVPDPNNNRIWFPAGEGDAIALWYAIVELRGGFGFSIKPIDDIPGTYFTFR